MNSVVYRKQQINRRRRSQWRTSTVTLVVGMFGLLLLVAALFPSLRRQQRAAAAADYTAADVANAAPFTAQHDMGQGPPVPLLPAAGPQPHLLISETRHDFGRIGPQDVVERTFILRNDGDAPLTISRAYTTCGCTTAKFSASVIPPGKVATVKLIFDAGFHDSAGQTVRRGLIVENNDPNQSQVEIWIQATVGS